LILPIIGIGLYPKLITTTYDVDTVQVASKVRASLPVIVENHVTAIKVAEVDLSAMPQIER